MLSFAPEKSSHIKLVEYEPDHKLLHVTFSTTGRRYTYRNVPQAAYTNFSRYRSPGQFLHQVIVKNYPLQEV